MTTTAPQQQLWEFKITKRLLLDVTPSLHILDRTEATQMGQRWIIKSSRSISEVGRAKPSASFATSTTPPVERTPIGEPRGHLARAYRTSFSVARFCQGPSIGRKPRSLHLFAYLLEAEPPPPKWEFRRGDKSEVGCQKFLPNKSVPFVRGGGPLQSDDENGQDRHGRFRTHKCLNFAPCIGARIGHRWSLPRIAPCN
jgi:hypothetical protein